MQTCFNLLDWETLRLVDIQKGRSSQLFWAANWLTPAAMVFLSTRESTPSSTCNLFYREGGKLWNIFQEKIQG